MGKIKKIKPLNKNIEYKVLLSVAHLSMVRLMSDFQSIAMCERINGVNLEKNKPLMDIYKKCKALSSAFVEYSIKKGLDSTKQNIKEP